MSTHKPGLLPTEPWGRGKTDDFLSVETFLVLETGRKNHVKTQWLIQCHLLLLSVASLSSRVGSRPGGRETSAECVGKPVSSSIKGGGWIKSVVS